MTNQFETRWYSEPWVWFNLLLLGVAVASASVMSVIAMQHTPAEIESSWYQDGVLAKRQRHQEALIAKLHLQGLMTITHDGRISLTTRHDKITNTMSEVKKIDVTTLRLYIEHPIQPDLDQIILLKRDNNNEYIGQLISPLKGKRRLMLTPADNSWFIISEGYFPSSSALQFAPVMNIPD